MKRAAAAWAVAAIVSAGACGFKSRNVASDDAGDAGPDGAPVGPPSLTPESHDYGSWLVGFQAMPVTFTVSTNAPTAALATSIIGVDTGDFVILANTCEGVALSAESTCSIDVSFRPMTPPYAAKSAMLRVVAAGGVMLTSTLIGRYDLSPDLVLTPGPSFAFGTVNVGSPSAVHTFRVSNAGTITSGVFTLVKSGADPTEFTVANDTCSTNALQGNAFCTFDVVFAPNGVGAKSAQVDITANPGGARTATFSGTGQALTIAPTPADFGDVLVGTTSPPKTLTVTNVAAAAVGPLVTSRAGNHPNDFALATDTCNGITLAPAATCTIDVTFTPTVVGTRNALVRLTVGGTIIVDGIIQGVGIPLVISPTSFAFTDTTSGQTSVAETFTLFNTSATTSGTITSTLSGTDPTQFTIVTAADTCTGLTVPAGGTCTINVTFTPTATGPKTATLTLSTTTTPAATASATLSGTGL